MQRSLAILCLAFLTGNLTDNSYKAISDSATGEEQPEFFSIPSVFSPLCCDTGLTARESPFELGTGSHLEAILSGSHLMGTSESPHLTEPTGFPLLKPPLLLSCKYPGCPLPYDLLPPLQ